MVDSRFLSIPDSFSLVILLAFHSITCITILHDTCKRNLKPRGNLVPEIRKIDGNSISRDATKEARHRNEDFNFFRSVAKASSYPILSYNPAHSRPVLTLALTLSILSHPYSTRLILPILPSLPNPTKFFPYTTLPKPSNLILSIKKIPQPLFILLCFVTTTIAFIFLSSIDMFSC
jgi:hypothetical protein